MVNATVLPTYSQAKFFKWSATLTAPLAASTGAQAIYWSSAPLDENGAIITGGFMATIRNTRSTPNRSEMVWIPASAVAADGLSATGCIRALNLSGIDYTTADSNNVYEFKTGDEIFCSITPQVGELLRSTLQGLIATGGANFIIGTDADGTVTVKRCTAVAGVYQGFLRWNTSTDKVEYSNDGSTWNSFDAVTASTLLTISSGDTTPAHAESKIVDDNDTIVITKLNAGGNEQLQIATGYSASKTEVDQALDGISANVTATNLNTLAGGVVSNADALHTHLGLGVYSFMAYEAISQYDAVCLLPIEVEHFSQLTDANLAIGDSNTRRKHAIKIVPSVTNSTGTTLQMRMAEAVNGATALGNLTISIQTDNAGAPSGTAVTGGTANVISQATQRTWTTAMGTRTITFASPPQMTAGVTYWLVIEVAATDGTNYLNISVNSAHDENYLTFTRLTYNLDTTSWGTSTTNATPFFWFNTELKLLGMALAQCDANWGGRTWNFIGFANTAIAAFSSGAVATDYAQLTGLTLTSGIDYFLSTTAGAITKTAPASIYFETTEPTAFTYKIGRALPSSAFKINTGQKRVMIAEEDLQATTTR